MRNSNKRHQPRQPQEAKPSDGLMSIEQFCKWADISVRQYYRQKSAGLGPREMRMGQRTIRISRDEAIAWAQRLTEGKAP